MLLVPGNKKVGDYKSSDEEKKTGFDATFATGNDENELRIDNQNS